MAIPYVKQTWTDGSGGGTPLSAARLAVIEGGIFDAHYQPAVRVFHNTTQAATTAVSLALAFNSERFDQASNASDTMHDTVTNNTRLTCRYAGVYMIGATISWAASAAGTARLLFFRLNGATDIGGRSFVPPLNSGGNGQSGVTVYSLAVNDYVEAMAFQDSGGNLNVVSSGNWTPEFWMVRIG